MTTTPSFRRLRHAACGLLLTLGVAGALAADKMTFLTSWYAQTKHGGFYQALAKGIYQKHGLDVTIRMGGPQVNGMQLLTIGQAGFLMGYDLPVLKSVEQGLPVTTVAASFQTDLQGMLTHDEVNGLADASTAQQTYRLSEPFQAMKAGVKSKFFLFANDGYPPCGTTIVTMNKTMQDKPGLLARFVKASMEGWKSDMADPAAANALIRQENPNRKDDQFACAMDKLKEFSFVGGGDASKQGIGTMSDARGAKTYDFMVEAGLLKAEAGWKKAYATQLVKDLKVMP
jgi:NitT/TauT family transport system substrate-binding protein